MTDFDMLKKVIDDSGMKMKSIAEKAGMSRATLYHRLGGVGEFTASEIVGMTKALHLTESQRDKIFFSKS